jgi:antitoxin MazE
MTRITALFNSVPKITSFERFRLILDALQLGNHNKINRLLSQRESEMRTNIIRIGNSQGVLIPKFLLEQSRLGTEVELEVENDRIVIRPVTHPRKGWEEIFRLAAQSEEDLKELP